jgi:xanthine dehydrogenase small subunit
MSQRPIRFFHRGRIVEVDAAAPTRSVLDWLRDDAHCVGTKEGCNEGDCGACTVVIGEIAAAGDPHAVRGLSLTTANACIRFLPTLDGKALFTVEDLKAMHGDALHAAPADEMHPVRPDELHPVRPDELHPVQRAMVDCHGSQCGFCTPGFVMSLWSAYEHHGANGSVPSRQQLADELSGNLCRCTGYRPIIDAGQRMFSLPASRLDTEPVLAALRSLRSEDDFDYGTQFHAPRTLGQLAALRAAKPDAKILAGATDMGLWVNKGLRDLGELIYVGEVAELKRIELRDGSLRIGAGASLEDAWRALAARWPALEDVWLRFASPPIRNAGTMGGNVANGSPIGDAPPVLMSLGAQVELRKGERVRTLALRDFYVDYMVNRMEPGEFVQALSVPVLQPPQPAWQVHAYKLSKRFDCDISAVCAGLAIALDGDTVKAARLCFGGMAATVRHAERAEAAIVGRAWTQATAQAAMEALGEDFKPLTDMRASAEYRLQAARNLLQRFWLETRTADPLPASALSVWSTMPHDTGVAVAVATAQGEVS